MDWIKNLTGKRLGKDNKSIEYYNDRTQFQRDYDRIIFSSPFRKMQNKTQVFPLPGSIFVHNRLTHSLEVASVGRSLGVIFSNKLKDNYPQITNKLIDELGTIVATACLAHDMGNPCFGHAGEKAISHFFEKNPGLDIKEKIQKEQWNDLINFEGNANAFRILTQNNKQIENPFSLTYNTLAAIIKYPCESTASKDKTKISQKKYGFFNSEKTFFTEVVKQCGMLSVQEDPVVYYRHPLVFLVEAADDICYNIIDVEDAHRLKILSTDETENLLFPLMGENIKNIKDRAYKIFDSEERISFLRAKAINSLIYFCSEAYWKHYPEISNAALNKDIKNTLDSQLIEQLKFIEKISIEKIYNHPAVLEKEIAGYKVIEGLLEEFVPAVIEDKKSHYNSKILKLLPEKYLTQSSDFYEKIMLILDFISGMTDNYAVEIFRKLKGISFPEIH